MKDDRLASERTFHNSRFAKRSLDVRASTWKWYSAMEPAESKFRQMIVSCAPGVRGLECGSGRGKLAMQMAPHFGHLLAIDISDDAVRNLQLNPRRPPNLQTAVMNVEALQLEEGSVDVVYGRSILHHLDLGRSLREIRRGLSANGRAIFLEPLGHNPVLNLFRLMTPRLRTPDERPLLTRDIQKMSDLFGRADVSYFGLFAPLAAPLSKLPFGPLLSRALQSLDKLAFKYVRWTRRLAWICVISLEKIEKAPS